MKKNQQKLLLKVIPLFLIIVIGALGSAYKLHEPKPAVEAPKKPNIIFILADDFGHHVPSINGNKYVKTPNIDALANAGARFTTNYVTAPICCASRAALLTGRYQQRFGSENHLHYPQNSAYAGNGGNEYLKRLNIDSQDVKTQGIPKTETNIAQLLKQNGYTTGIIGKWHAGFYDGYRPHQRGFDYSWGWFGGSTLYYTEEEDQDYVTYKDKNNHYHHYVSATGKYQWKRDPIATGIFKNGKLTDEKDYQTYAIAREAEAFIDQNKNKPFFLYVPFGAIHTPLQADKKHYDQLGHIKDEQQRILFAMVLGLDEAIGRITKKLKEAGLEENTIIAFSGDNGSTYHKLTNDAGLVASNAGLSLQSAGYTLYDDSYENPNRPLKGGKLTHYEGGIRTPLFIKYPGKIKPGTVYQNPVTLMDLFPTFAAATGTPLPKNKKIDGVDLVPYLQGKTQQKPHETLFWRNLGIKTVRKGYYKLLINEPDKTTYLYNLKNDPAESKDLAKQEPQLVAQLTAEFKNWERELAAPRWKSPRTQSIVVDGEKVSFQP